MIIWMKVTPLKMKSGSVPSFYSMLPKNIILPMMGLPIYPIQLWLVDSLFSQVKERISAHLSDTVDVDKETILKICEPGDIFLGLISGKNFIEYCYKCISRLTIVSREAKKKQAVRDEQVCYLQVAPL